MAIIFLGGSRSITAVPVEVLVRVQNICAQGHQVVVGDAYGADLAFQRALGMYRNAIVYHVNAVPRNNVGLWSTFGVAAGGRVKHTAKDLAMANVCTHGLFVWDGQSQGTLDNIAEMRRLGKHGLVWSRTGSWQF